MLFIRRKGNNSKHAKLYVADCEYIVLEEYANSKVQLTTRQMRKLSLWSPNSTSDTGTRHVQIILIASSEVTTGSLPVSAHLPE